MDFCHDTKVELASHDAVKKLARDVAEQMSPTDTLSQEKLAELSEKLSNDDNGVLATDNLEDNLRKYLTVNRNLLPKYFLNEGQTAQ